MSKYELSDIAQVLAILGVIISLAFVGLEINQNTSLARNQAYLEYVESLKDLTLEIATDDALPGLIARLVEGEMEEGFSAEDNVRIPLFQNATVRVWAKHLSAALNTAAMKSAASSVPSLSIMVMES
jgi:hypothetical protein